MSIAHPNPGKWAWYAAFDGGEHFPVGPCSTRGAAIIEAVIDGSGEYTEDGENWRTRFVVAECQENHVDLASWFVAEKWLGSISERMDEDACGADEDGENHPLDTITEELLASLEASVRLAIRHWQARHSLPLRSSYFAGSGNHRKIDIPIKSAETREEAAIELIRSGTLEEEGMQA